jgi:LacI family gluconate utilization system Gnt-I transcriptional repressor
VRIEDVAREAGVSPITVSRALSTPKKVRPETRQRVLEAVEKTGYVVNSIASSLRSGRSSIVTVFVSSLLNPHLAAIIQGALDAFEGSRYRLMFAQTGHTDGVRAEIVEMIRPFSPAAVMFTAIPLLQAARERLRATGVPIMEVWSGSDDPIDMAAGASIAEGTRQMGEHFARQGYRNVAYCGLTTSPGGEGLDGFRKGLESNGAALGHVMPFAGPGTLGQGIQLFHRIRTDYPQCDAIYFGSDLLAVGAQIAAREVGVNLPSDIAMAGYGDLDFAAYTTPPLTTIQVSDYDTGRLAAQALRVRLEGGPRSGPVIQVPMRLIVRDSTPPRLGKK